MKKIKVITILILTLHVSVHGQKIEIISSKKYILDAKSAIHLRNLTSARRLAQAAVYAAKYQENKLPSCGMPTNDGNIKYVAFPPNEALKVYIVDSGQIGYFDLTKNLVVPIWQATLSVGTKGKGIRPTNAISRQFSNKTTGLLYVSNICGNQPISSDDLLQFVTSTPPGHVEAGIVSKKGFFHVKSIRDFEKIQILPTENTKDSEYNIWRF